MLKVKLKKSVALAVMIAFVVSPVVAKELKGWNIHPPGYPVTVAMESFSAAITKATNGKLKAKTYNSGLLGNQNQAIQQIQLGGIDFAVFNLVPLNNIVAETQLATLPYVFRSMDHMHRVMDGKIGDEIGDALAKHNMIALAWYDSGARSLYSKYKLNSITDLKGLKFRVQNSDMNAAMIEALGASATTIPYGEVYTSIQSGLIDGAENNWPSYQSSGHYEVAKNYLLDGHAIVPEVFAMNKSVWDSLSIADKKTVRSAARDSAVLQRKLWKEQVKKSEKIVRASGVKVVEVKDKTQFIKAMKPVYDKFVTTTKMRDMLQRIQDTQ